MLHWIDDETPLPPTRLALGADSDAPGLLAAGGRVTPQRLVEAYSRGIFPWYSEGQPPLWWSPDPRMVLPVDGFHLSHTLRKTLRRFLRTAGCAVRFDTCFEAVMHACASTPRQGQDGTWIQPELLQAYTAVHRQGVAHSVETYINGELAGGLYFMNLGRMCFGESMFAWRTDASKIALAALVAACRARGVRLIDCQQNTGHLARMGAHEITRRAFEAHLETSVRAAAVATWSYDEDEMQNLLLNNPPGPASRPNSPSGA